MATEILKGIVIKTLDYDDYDKIITIATRDEIIGFIALGVRKIKSKNRVALQLGNVIEVELFRSRLKGKLSKLKRATIVNQPEIKEADTAFVLLSIIKSLKTIRKSSSQLFDAYTKGILDMGNEFNHNFKTFVLTRLLDVEGEWPVWDRCVECGRTDMIADFQFYKGGFLCTLHAVKDRNIEILKAFKSLGKSWEEYKKIESDINYYVQEELKDYLSNSFYYKF